MTEKNMEASVEYIKEVFNQSYESFKTYMPNKVCMASDDLILAFGRQMTEIFEAGYHMGLDKHRKILEEVNNKIILDELKRHPKMSLKTFAKNHGIIKEEEEPN